MITLDDLCAHLLPPDDRINPRSRGLNRHSAPLMSN